MDVIRLLTDDHNKVRELFKTFNGGGALTGAVRRMIGAVSADERRFAVNEVCRELGVHTTIEEELFYPAVRELRDQELNRMVKEALDEHAAVKQELAALRGVSGDEELSKRMAQLQKEVEHHASEEEDEMFPRLEELMPEENRDALGRRLAALKRRVSAEAAGSGRPPARAAREHARPARTALRS